jgi:hypothetical protein|tara:strand:- start:319 stop:522 length:204 start_codon:yes stop_codon:yes gene_type:complete
LKIERSIKNPIKTLGATKETKYNTDDDDGMTELVLIMFDLTELLLALFIIYIYTIINKLNITHDNTY